MILAGRRRRWNPCEVRSSLSQSPSRCASLPPIGQKTATKSFYADVRFVNGIRSLVTVVAASRLMTSTTTGSGFIADAASIAGRPSLSFRRSLFRTRITACLRVSRRCCCVSWNTARGKWHCPSFKILIGCLIRPPSVAGRVAWTVLNWFLPFSTRPSLAWFTGWRAVIWLPMKQGRYPG